MGVTRSKWAFCQPEQPYLPGVTERPDEARFAGFKVGLTPELTPEDLAGSDAFDAGIEAFCQGFYWEAHELWEPVWMCLPAGSGERQVMQGLIQLTNAGLKAAMGRPRAVIRILAMSDEHFRNAELGRPENRLGINATMINDMRRKVCKEAGL